MSDNIIQINNMNKWFGDFQVLKQINLEVTEFQKAFKEHGSEELISQTIRETIKPILNEWLKINLPVIVSEVIDEKINEIREKN